MRSIEFTLTGEMPLLMHQDDVELADELDAWRKDPAHKNISKAGDDRSPAWTWQTYCYSDGEHLAIPSANIMVCLRSAGTQMILKKQKTFKELTQSGLLITSEFCEFTVGGKQIAVSDLEDMREKDFKAQANECRKHGFRLFVKRARVGSSKHVRVRPRFDSWQVRGTMQVLAAEFTRDLLAQLFEIAGRVGLSDWRPGCRTPGPFGMFKASLK